VPEIAMSAGDGGLRERHRMRDVHLFECHAPGRRAKRDRVLRIDHRYVAQPRVADRIGAKERVLCLIN
jgi:hypothetical protein